MKIAKFKNFLPIDPIRGIGFMEGAEVLLTENQVSKFSQAVRGRRWEDAVELRDIPAGWLYDGGEIAPDSTVSFWYPAGIGDAVCHTALIWGIRKLVTNGSVRVYSSAYCAPVWFLNPIIEDRCARSEFPTLAAMNRCDVRILGEEVMYRMTGKDQPNIYDALSSHFKIPLADNEKKPCLFVAEQETVILMKKLGSVLRHDVSDEALMIFAPCASKPNRTWTPAHWIEFVDRAQKELGYRVIAIGGREDTERLSILADKCIVLPGMLTERDMIVLAHQADRIVTVDSAMLHIGAAFDCPTVALMGPFSPLMRCSTYRCCHPIYVPDGCADAPCGWHDAGFPKPECGQYSCKIMDTITADAVIKKLESIEGKPGSVIVLPPEKKIITLYDRQ